MSLVKENALKDPNYAPYCLRCPGLVRMVKVEPLYWRCRCGAQHDEGKPMKPTVGESVQNAHLERAR